MEHKTIRIGNQLAVEDKDLGDVFPHFPIYVFMGNGVIHSIRSQKEMNVGTVMGTIISLVLNV